LAKILGHLETRGAAVVVPLIEQALASGTPPLLALAPVPMAPTLSADVVPAVLREVEVDTGRAADYDTWLQGVA
jgi:hypothetical protein